MGSIKLSIRFDNDFYKHLQDRKRQDIAINLEDILQNPNEVWITYKFNGKSPENIHFFSGTKMSLLY